MVRLARRQKFEYPIGQFFLVGFHIILICEKMGGIMVKIREKLSCVELKFWKLYIWKCYTMHRERAAPLT